MTNPKFQTREDYEAWKRLQADATKTEPPELSRRSLLERWGRRLHGVRTPPTLDRPQPEPPPEAASPARATTPVAGPVCIAFGVLILFVSIIVFFIESESAVRQIVALVWLLIAVVLLVGGIALVKLHRLCELTRLGLALLLALLLPCLADAAGKLYMKQGYAIEVDEWWEDAAQGLLWYRKGTLKSAVTRSDVVKIEGTTTENPPLVAPRVARTGSPLEVIKSDFTIIDRSRYIWRLGYTVQIRNHLDRAVKARVIVFFEDWGGRVLQHGKELETTITPGLNDYSGYSGLVEEMAREVTRIRANVLVLP